MIRKASIRAHHSSHLLHSENIRFPQHMLLSCSGLTYMTVPPGGSIFSSPYTTHIALRYLSGTGACPSVNIILLSTLRVNAPVAAFEVRSAPAHEFHLFDVLFSPYVMESVEDRIETTRFHFGKGQYVSAFSQEVPQQLIVHRPAGIKNDLRFRNGDLLQHRSDYAVFQHGVGI